MIEPLDIAITTLAGLTVLINTFGLISVMRNYRRLRQRMFMFVISLTMANAIVGTAFLFDVISRMLDLKQSSTKKYNQSYCDLNTSDWLTYTESFKSASVVLSTLNSIILTFALHKRTTRMGRHREETGSSLNLNTDGATTLHLPAFDTMMRVLNFKSAPTAPSTEEKAYSQNNSNRSSTGSKTANNDDKPPNQVEEEAEKPSKVQSRYYKKKKMNKFASILVPGSSVHSRGSSRLARASDSYIGRHSVSIVSIQASLCMLLFVWLCFVTMLIVPIVMRLYGTEESDGSIHSLAVCPQTCNQTLPIARQQLKQLADMNKDLNSMFNDTAPTGKLQRDEDSLHTLTATCSGCSKSFYPLTKLQTAASALIVIVTWLYMLYSSMRLLWLRKHSNNVFVRCSALWRFILLTAIFHMLGTLLYVVLCIVDVTGDVITEDLYPPFNSIWNQMSPSNASVLIVKSNLTTDGLQDESSSDTVTSPDDIWQTFCYFTSQTGVYVSFSSIFLLLHSAFAPLLYLLRLLGIRRLVTFL